MIVRLTRDTVTYSFTTPSGKSASGEVSHVVREPIMAIFEKHAGRTPITLSTDSNIESKFDVSLHSANAGGKCYLVCPYSPSRLDHIERVECFDASLSSRASSWEEVTQTVESQLILLVEDNAIFARVLEKFFLKQGIATFHCENGVTALEYLNQGNNLPDLVLCDVHMPHMNGIELVKRLRSERRFDAMPIAIITSDDQTDTELRLLEEGADAFVSKSEDPRLLTVKVKRLLEKKGAKRAA